MVARRFDVLLLRLGPSVGAEMKRTRPCVVVSPDEMNRYIRTVIVAPMTTRGRPYPTRVPCTFKRKKGQVVLDQIRAVDAEWVSLQYDPADKPGWNEPIVKQFNADTGLNIHHWPDVINNLDEDYGGLIHALDLIISVNTSLVHACGAYGVTCWTLTPSKPAWRYGLTGREMPWYGPWVQQMRQTGDDWGPVLKYLETAIPDYLSHKEAA